MKSRVLIYTLLFCLFGIGIVACGTSAGSSSTVVAQSDDSDDSESDDDSAEDSEDTIDPAICGNEIGNGATIIDGPDGPEGADYDQSFRSLVVHPTDPNIVVVGTERNGVLKTTDGGDTWTRLRTGFRHTDTMYMEVWDIAISASNPDILFAATLDSPGPPTGNAPSAVGGVYKSNDGGETWSRKNCGLLSSRITSVRIHPSNPDIVVIGVEGGAPSYSEPEKDYYPGGIYKTTNGGDTWALVSAGLTNHERNGYWHMKIDPSNPTTLYTFAMNHDNTAESLGLLKSTDMGSNWTQITTPYTSDIVDSISISGSQSAIALHARSNYNLLISTNNAASFTESQPEAAQLNGPIAIHPTNNQRISYSNLLDLALSTDQGNSATVVIDNGPDHFEDIEFAPSNPNIVYAIARGYHIYRSANGGESWTLVKSLRDEGVL